jgi:hypothetical protein
MFIKDRRLNPKEELFLRSSFGLFKFFEEIYSGKDRIICFFVSSLEPLSPSRIIGGLS